MSKQKGGNNEALPHKVPSAKAYARKPGRIASQRKGGRVSGPKLSDLK